MSKELPILNNKVLKTLFLQKIVEITSTSQLILILNNFKLNKYISVNFKSA